MKKKIFVECIKDKDFYNLVKQDYDSMPSLDFLYKYKVTWITARKYLWKKKTVYKPRRCLSDIDIHNYSNVFDKEIAIIRKEIKEKHNISDLLIDQLLKDYTFTEISQWQMIKWKFIVSDLIYIKH